MYLFFETRYSIKHSIRRLLFDPITTRCGVAKFGGRLAIEISRDNYPSNALPCKRRSAERLPDRSLKAHVGCSRSANRKRSHFEGGVRAALSSDRGCARTC